MTAVVLLSKVTKPDLSSLFLFLSQLKCVQYSMDQLGNLGFLEHRAYPVYWFLSALVFGYQGGHHGQQEQVLVFQCQFQEICE